jgi:hypothetical protein
VRRRLRHPLARSRRGSQHGGFIARRTGTGSFGTSPNKPLQASAKSAPRLSVASESGETTVDEVQISKVAAVLAEWNPLGSRADTVSDLDGYRIEAIDIIMALGVFRRFVAPEETVSDILNQAFDLSMKPIDCVVPARKIQLIVEAG